MPAPVRHGVDLPDVALVAKLWNICIRIGSGSSWQIDFLDILLSGNAASVLGSRASCAFHAPYCRFRNRLRDGGSIVIVAAGLGQQENMLIAAAWPVLGAFRHGIRLLPDDVRAHIPTVCAQRKGKQPWHANHILCLAALHLAVEGDRLPRPAVGILGVEGVAAVDAVSLHSRTHPLEAW